MKAKANKVPFSPPKRPKRILALDTGLMTGWAFNARRGPIRSGTHDFMPVAGETGRVLAVFEEWLLDTITELKPELVVYEKPFHRGSGSSLLWGFAAIVEKAAYHRELFVAHVPPSVIKVHGACRGNATKADMMAAAEARGWTPGSDHEADALHLLDYAQVHLREAA